MNCPSTTRGWQCYNCSLQHESWLWASLLCTGLILPSRFCLIARSLKYSCLPATTYITMPRIMQLLHIRELIWEKSHLYTEAEILFSVVHNFQAIIVQAWNQVFFNHCTTLAVNSAPPTYSLGMVIASVTRKLSHENWMFYASRWSPTISGKKI